MPSRATGPTDEEIERSERLSVLEQLDDWLRGPMLVLSFAWLALVLVELAWGGSRLLEVFGTAIWIVLLIEFALRFALAPDKPLILRANWLSALALLAPVLRVLRLTRAARAAWDMRLVSVVGTANRGMNALRASLGRRSLGFVLAFTVLVALLGAGGMLAFEPAREIEGGFSGYGDALWWTAMLLTSLGSEFWPRTLEGRLLCLLLSLYGFAVFGYITASFASFFVSRDAASEAAEVVSSADHAALRAETHRTP